MTHIFKQELNPETHKFVAWSTHWLEMSQAGSLHYSTWNSDIKKPFAKRKNTWSQIYQHSGGENATSSQIYHLWPSLRSTSECFLSLARQPAWEAKHTWTKWLTCQKTYHLPNGILTLRALPPSSHLQELGMVQQCLSLFPALPTWLTIRSGTACKLVSWSLSTNRCMTLAGLSAHQ